jgi:photosystem II stability/assembly factor-like uncharacterized protein
MSLRWRSWLWNVAGPVGSGVKKDYFSKSVFPKSISYLRIVMKLLLTVVVCVVSATSLSLQASTVQSDSSRWENPDGGEWFTIDSIQDKLPAIYYASDCSDTNDCVALASTPAMTQRSLIRRTSDAGRSWNTIRVDSLFQKVNELGQTVSVEFPARRAVSHPTTSSIYVVCDSGYVLRSFDGGLSWDERKIGVKKMRAKRITFRGRIGFVLFDSDNSLYLSEDYGDTWKQQKIALPDSTKWITDAVLIDSTTIFASVLKTIQTDTNEVYTFCVSRDRAKSWQVLSFKPKNFYLYNFTFVSRLLGFAGSGKGLCKTTDGGVTWNIKTEPALQIKFCDSLNGIAVSTLKYYLTNDGGENWRKYDELTFDTYKLGQPYICPQFLGKQHPIMFSGSHVFKYDPKTPTSIESDISRTRSRYLIEIMTKERNDIVALDGSIPSEYTLRVVDLQGRTIIQSHHQNYGLDTPLPVDCTHLQNGAYILSIESGTQVCKSTFLVY